MPSLEILDVSKNKIEKLPKTCGTLRSLKVLSIKENAIRKLPSYFAQSELGVPSRGEMELKFEPQ